MRRLGSAFLAVSIFAGCGGLEAETSPEPLASPSLESQQSPILTTTDVDVALECEGILVFANTASYATLDRFLPSNVVTNLVNRRATRSFTSLADLSSVPLVGETRLKELEGGARTLDYIDADCTGIFDGVALSHDDAAAIVSLVNTIDDSELHDVLPDAWNGAANLLNLRPFTSAQAISNVAGIGPVSFRNIRNAATLSRPFEALATAVNALPSNGSYGAQLKRHFDWWNEVTANHPYSRGGPTCFGLEPRSVPSGASIRPYLADAAEVRAEVVSTLGYVNANNRISSSVINAGLANLDARIAGRSFKGCIFTYADDPWSSHSVAIFVDTVNGFSVMTETWWAE
jgi:DNA uptake protein ComE-like DNA-binding protein